MKKAYTKKEIKFREKAVKDWLREGLLVDGYKIELTYRHYDEVRSVRRIVPMFPTDIAMLEEFRNMIQEIKSSPRKTKP